MDGIPAEYFAILDPQKKTYFMLIRNAFFVTPNYRIFESGFFFFNVFQQSHFQYIVTNVRSGYIYWEETAASTYVCMNKKTCAVDVGMLLTSKQTRSTFLYTTESSRQFESTSRREIIVSSQSLVCISGST